MSRYCHLFAARAAVGLAVVCGWGVPCAHGAPPTIPSISIEYREAAARRQARVELTGLPADAIAAIESGRDQRTQWNRVLALYVVDGAAVAEQPMIGSYSIDGDILVFQPRFPLQPGLEYLAVFHAAGLPVRDVSVPAEVSARIALSKPEKKPTVVEAVYPSSDALPENLLKFYVHFSGPMRRGRSYRHVQLIRDDGQPIERPFLELGEELWNQEGTRFTLFFDPGRIKRGLKPREEMGPALEAGFGYTLTIDSAWIDAYGNQLAETHRKEFTVTAPDTVQPEPRRWKIHPPQAGDDPLSVTFRESLDHAMLQRSLRIIGPDNHVVAGEIRTRESEMVWQFHPDKPWPAGGYRLVVAPTLEDLAGNSVGRPFEVKLDESPRTTMAEPVVLQFEVQAKAAVR